MSVSVVVVVVGIMVMTAIGPMHVRFDPEALMVGMAMMRVAVMMGVIVIMMIVAVIMPARVRRSAHVGAAFRVERRFDRDDLRAQAPRHLLDHRIAPHAQALPQELGRQMA